MQFVVRKQLLLGTGDLIMMMTWEFAKSSP